MLVACDSAGWAGLGTRLRPELQVVDLRLDCQCQECQPAASEGHWQPKALSAKTSLQYRFNGTRRISTVS